MVYVACGHRQNLSPVSKYYIGNDKLYSLVMCDMSYQYFLSLNAPLFLQMNMGYLFVENVYVQVKKEVFSTGWNLFLLHLITHPVKEVHLLIQLQILEIHMLWETFIPRSLIIEFFFLSLRFLWRTLHNLYELCYHYYYLFVNYLLFQISHDNASNLSHSPQVSRSLQSTALARHNPTPPWSHSLTRAQEEVHRAPSPPNSTGARYPIVNNHVPVAQSYGSSPGVDRGVQSSLLSLASDPYGGSKKMCADRCKMNSLQSNPSKFLCRTIT